MQGFLDHWIGLNVDMRMPFHVSTKAVNDDQDAHPHFLDIPSPLLYGFSGCMNQKNETCLTMHQDDDGCNMVTNMRGGTKLRLYRETASCPPGRKSYPLSELEALRAGSRAGGPADWKPNSELFKPSIDIFSFHDWFISWIVIFLNKMD
jgi:hypothetical protein